MVTINEQFGSGTGNSQVNNCTSNFCLNRVIGNDNTQTNNCRDGSVCNNEVAEDRNTQTHNCVVGDPCISGTIILKTLIARDSAVGDNNVQNMKCKVDFINICENSARGERNTRS